MTDLDRDRQLDMLVQIAELLSTLDLDELLLRIIKITTDTVGAARGSFFLLDEQGRAVQRFIAARDLPPQMKPIVSEQILKKGLARWVLENRQAALVEDTFLDSRWYTLSDDSDFQRVRSAICVPFFVQGQVRGVMTLEHPERAKFDMGAVRLVEAAANQAGIALRNAQLFERVTSQQRQLQAVVNSIPEALIVTDSQWVIKLYNPAARILMGITDAFDMRDRSLADISETFSQPIFRQIVKHSETLAQDRSKVFEMRDDHTGRDFMVHVTDIQDSNPQSNGYVIVMYDVTALKDLNRLKTHMLNMASHDLKNPIGVLRGYLDVIRSDANGGTPPDPMFLDNMYKAINRMEGLVATLLEVQRAEQISPLKRELIDPYELVHVVLDDMGPSADRRNHTLVPNIQDGMNNFKGDFMRLREVMNNLIENAIKYTPDGGRMIITVFMEEERFCFNVKDNGVGIPAEQQTGVFQPYFRARHETTAHISGTGLGLSLVKEIIERHGGQVWFSSVEDHGSTFGFWVPLLV